MAGCSGNCGSCGGCAKELVLTAGEVQMLELLAQIPFLPVARRADDMTPVYLEADGPADCSLVLQVLEKKQLIDINYSKALTGADMAVYQGYPVHGSIALTARGQQVIDLIQNQGIEE